MITGFHPAFDRMDALSREKIPFFFMIDFLSENIVLTTVEELSNSGILINFPHFKNYELPDISPELTEFTAFPESQESYKKGFDHVQRNLKLGNSYQLVFFSPETFVEVRNGKIFTHPMKGTIDAEIENAAEILKNNVKEKAEHYTVVDLLRNDLSMVADEVKVEEFQRIDFIRTKQKNLYAMSSEISGILKPEFLGKTGSIMKSLLPAGSVLGAPKPKTLEIVLESEGYKRGWYTGVCGWFDGENMDSCVMIRFIEKENGILYFKSGGGITHLSNLEDEYQEMKNKIYVPVH